MGSHTAPEDTLPTQNSRRRQLEPNLLGTLNQTCLNVWLSKRLVVSNYVPVFYVLRGLRRLEHRRFFGTGDGDVPL
ncbi:hypothetical protein E2C01_078597 [Portunus trituberculatus]|uniref:Uncharacterized protein n=1 Tax=Portunus trituberculatus TaxID=210409 RepID=A0A5B7IQL2_PORTR|nr:hypothetical protein [Portunus trituberculatus]